MNYLPKCPTRVFSIFKKLGTTISLAWFPATSTFFLDKSQRVSDLQEDLNRYQSGKPKTMNSDKGKKTHVALT